MERPLLNKNLDSNTFRDFYYLKQELVRFCRENGLPISGGKEELTERIAFFLETGGILQSAALKKNRKNVCQDEITVDTEIETDCVCSEKHRVFFKQHIGDGFLFNVAFQKWLKANAGKTYRDAITAYHDIREQKKKGKVAIDKQFEYNTYIRDFFADNTGRTLEEAIRCWKYKKSRQGHNRYERADLTAIDNE